MANRLNYEIGFSADTSQLKQQLKQLQGDLEKISLGKVRNIVPTNEFNEAAEAAGRLNIALKNAANVNTGRLDLSKFAAQLKSSGLTLDQYRQKLNLIGASGTNAFMNVAKAIAQAELPLARSSKLLDQLWISMKNTTRWQLSSSALNAFMGGIQAAYGYAQDLNASLNNIRIVSGASTQEMAKFAKQANEAAGALNTTTNEYAKASLIYFQQGLQGEKVTERADATIKMANVSKQSAQEVSDQLTSIWNNFDDGTKSLEYYADVITALGAATASSSEEISEGLERFSAIASSIGLSYEYATSALATVTATTRQSADVVGTAYKTLFARIQGLQLGETLDDGTTLNKYSEALMKVGINIKDQNGEIKKMDTILDEMADKWGTLNKDQQIALAQTVAGVRQYNQLVALMDNWDFMEQNLAVARDSSGELQRQADVYAESWEAARDRVQAASENVYDSLINEDFFIGLDDALASLLNGVSTVVDSMGGFGGVLLTVGTLMTSVYGDKMAQGIRNIAYNIRVLTGVEEARAIALKQQAVESLKQQAMDIGDSPELVVMTEMYERQAQMQIDINNSAKQLTETQLQEISQESQLLNLIIERAAAYAKMVEEAQNNADVAKQSILMDTDFSQEKYDEGKKEYKGDVTVVESRAKAAAGIDGELDVSTKKKMLNAYEQEATKIGIVSKALRDYNSIQKMANKDSTENVQKLNNLKQIFAQYGTSVENAGAMISQWRDGMTAMKTVLTDFEKAPESVSKSLTEMAQNSMRAGQAQANLDETSSEQQSKLEQLRGEIVRFSQSQGDYANKIVGVANTLGQVGMAISAMQSLGSVFTDEDMTAGERIISIFTSLSMLLPIIASLYSALTEKSTASTLAQILQARAVNELNDEYEKNVAEMNATTLGKLKLAVATKVSAVAEKLLGKAAATTTGALVGQLVVIGLIVAAVALVAVGIYALVKAYNAEADAAKKAGETAKNLADASDEATNRLNEIKSAVDAYDSAIDKLNSCTKGTEEWNNALAGVQKEIDSLLKKFPQLLKEKDLYNEDGTLNQDVLDRAVQEAEKTSQAATQAAIRGQIAAEQANTTLAIHKATNPQIGQYVAVEGSTAAINYNEQNVQQDVDKVLAQYDQIGSKLLDASDAATILGDVSDEYADTITNLAQKCIDTGTMLENANEKAVREWARANDRELDDAETGLIGSIQGEMNRQYSEALKKVSDQNTNTDSRDISRLSGEIFAGTTLEGVSLTEAFNIARGTDYELATNAVRGTDNNRRYVYLENGEEKEYTEEQIRATIAAYLEIENMGNAAAQVSETFLELKDNVGEGNEAVAEGIKNLIATKNFESMSEADFNKLEEEAKKNNQDIVSYIKSSLGYSNDEMAAAFGDNWRTVINIAARNYRTALNGITDNLLEAVKTAYEETQNIESIVNLSPAAKKRIARAYQDAYVSSGEEGLNTVKEAIQSLDPKNAEKFTEVLSTMNWSTEGPEDFIRKLNEADVQTGLSSFQLFTLAKILGKNVVPNTEAAADKFTNISKILGDLKIGDIIDQTKYDELKEYGEEYFVKMLDGTYMLIGSADELRKKSREAYLEEARQNSKRKAENLAWFQGQFVERYSSYVEDGQFQDDFFKSSYQNAQLDKTRANLQVDVLEHLDQYSPEQVAIYREKINTGRFSLADATQVKNDLNAHKEMIQDVDQFIVNGTKELSELNLSTVVSTANSIAELRAMSNEYNMTNEDREKALEAVTIKEAERYGFDVEDVQDMADAIQEERKELELTNEEARELAIYTMRASKGQDALNENWEKWYSVIKKVKSQKLEKTSQDYIDTIQDLTKAIADLIGVSEDLDLSDEFFADDENLELVEQASKGSKNSRALLGIAVAKDMISQERDTMIEDTQSSIKALQDKNINGQFDAEINAQQQKLDGYLGTYKTVMDGITSIFDEVKTKGISAVAEMTDQGDLLSSTWFDAVNKMARDAGWGVTEMQNFLKALNIEAELITKDEPLTTQIPEYATYEAEDPTRSYTDEETGVHYNAKRSYTELIGYKPVTEVRKIAQINYGPDAGKQPRIKNYGTASTSGSGKKGGGGGGGGSSSKPKKQTYTKQNEVQERYKKISDQIDIVTRATKNLNRETEKLYGSKRFANMDKEIAKLKEQADLINQKNQEAKNYLGTLQSGDKGDLVKTAADLGFTITEDNFGDKGNLLTIEDIQKSLWERQHEMEVKYNSFASSEEQQKYQEEVMQPFLDLVEAWTKAYELYEDTRKIYMDGLEEQQEILDQIESKRIEKLVTTIEIQLEFKEAKKELNDIDKQIRETIGEAWEYTAESMSLDYTNALIEVSKFKDLNTEQAGEFLREFQQLVELAKESRTNTNISQEELASQFANLRNEIFPTIESLLEYINIMEEGLPNAIDSARESFDKFISQLEHNTTVIDSIKEIMTLQGLNVKTAQGFRDMDKIHRETIDSNLAQAKLNKTWLDRVTQEVEQARINLENAPKGTVQEELARKEYETLLAQQNEAQEASLASSQKYLESLEARYMDTIDHIAWQAEEKLTDGLGFDLLQEKYDHYIETEERYLDTVNQIYEVTTLYNKLQREVDKTTNQAGIAKLKALQEEFDLRKANNKLSQYDIDIMNAKLDLTLKQIALEEAQNNKSQLRLVRNAQGNWNYQYTANLDDVDSANQDYLDSQNEYYNLAKDRAKEISAEIIATEQEAMEKLAELERNDNKLTPEQLERAKAEIEEYYIQRRVYLQGELQKAIADTNEAGQQSINNFRDNHISSLTDMANSTNDFENTFAANIEAMTGDVNEFSEVFHNTITKMDGEYLKFQQTMENANIELGISYGELKDMIGEVSDSTNTLETEGYDSIHMMWDQISAVRLVSEEYQKEADKIYAVIKALRELGEETMRWQFERLGGDDIDYSALIAQGIVRGNISETQLAKLTTARSQSAHWSGDENSKNWHSNDWIIAAAQAYKNNTATREQREWVENALNVNKGVYNTQDGNAIMNYIIDKYGLATGGYTGVFNDTKAKLAFLHEKELVLNQTDTKNILDAVQLMRNFGRLRENIAEILDRNIAMAQEMMANKLAHVLMPVARNNNNEIIREATIYAEFPNVHDARDVEEALRNLANDAYQYASQPRK